MNAAHYLDHAATSPVRPEVLEAWTDAQRRLASTPGNPASLHAGGRAARLLLEEARERIAARLGADRAEVVLTSGATESDALGVAGLARGARSRDERRRLVLTSPVEHDAVAEQVPLLVAEGFDHAHLDLGDDGVVRVDVDRLEGLAPQLAVASLALVCSELGTVQPVRDLATAIHEAGAGGLVHTDAAQAPLTRAVDFHDLGVDALTVGGHKIGAPVGTGALLVRRGVPVRTDRPGGGHERGLRSGTPDVAGACALARALELAEAEREGLGARLEGLRSRLLSGLPDGVRETVPPQVASPAIVHLSLDTHHPEALLLAMDAAGVLVSAGSACHAGVTRPSGPVLAMGRTEEEALGVMRVSMGPGTTADDVDAFLAALPAALAAAHALDGRGRG